MSLLSRLLGRPSAPKPEPQPETYNDFRIFVEPIQEGGRYRVAARIEKEIGGETRYHRMIRADTCDTADLAEEVTTRKAKQLIDQLGEAVFR